MSRVKRIRRSYLEGLATRDSTSPEEPVTQDVAIVPLVLILRTIPELSRQNARLCLSRYPMRTNKVKLFYSNPNFRSQPPVDCMADYHLQSLRHALKRFRVPPSHKQNCGPFLPGGSFAYGFTIPIFTVIFDFNSICQVADCDHVNGLVTSLKSPSEMLADCVQTVLGGRH